MLKFRIIFMSFLFLLLVGMNSNARASVAVNELVQNSLDEGQSNEEAPEQESGEIITHLDFFGAFSLVNIQLQWRDIFVDLSDEESDSDASINPKEIFAEGVEFFSSSVNDELLPTSVIITNGIPVLPLSAYRTIDGKVNPIPIQNKQSVSTIAYILNCGTYPKSC